MAEFTQIRRIDDLGRICIPREIRKNLGINEGDPLKITLINNSIIIRPTPSDASVQAALDRFLLNLKYDFDIDPDLREELRRKTLEMKDLAQNAQEKHKKENV